MVEKIRKYTRIAGFAATWDTKKAGKHHPQWHNDTPSTFKNKRTQGDSSIIKQKKLQTRIFAGLESKKKEHETGIEPATPSLARRCSTAEPLVHIVQACTCHEGMKLIVRGFSTIPKAESR